MLPPIVASLVSFTHRRNDWRRLARIALVVACVASSSSGKTSEQSRGSRELKWTRQGDLLHAEGGEELVMGDRVIFQVEQLKNAAQKAKVAQKCKTTAPICISAWPIKDVCACNESQPVQYQLAAEVAFKPKGSAESPIGVVVREGEPGLSFVAPRDGKLVPRDVPLDELKTDIEKMKPQVCQKTPNPKCKGMVPDGDPSVTDEVGHKPFILPYVVCQAGKKKGSATSNPCEEAGK